MADMAKQHGLSLDEVLGKGRKGKGSVAAKYRDPKNPANTWTGRGRMRFGWLPRRRATSEEG
jgi:DNA-binding protein H-NS